MASKDNSKTSKAQGDRRNSRRGWEIA